MGKRQLSQVLEKGPLLYSNTFRKVSHSVATHIKCPVNIGEVSWKLFRLYVRYLDLKAQSPDLGTFKIYHTRRAYQRVIKSLIEKGWATRTKGTVSLRAYQYVWRAMEIDRVRIRGVLRFKYWKIPIDRLPSERQDYLKEIENIIRKKVTMRKLAQLRFALNEKGLNKDQATFSARSTSDLFGYRSTSSGSKLRKRYFEIIPQSPEQAKTYFNHAHGRWEDPPKRIAL